MVNDLTNGKVLPLILKFSIPMLLGQILQQLYNLVDTIIVGRFLGENPLAAVGATGSIFFFILGFCIGTCSGFAIPISREFGAKRESELRKYVANCVWLCIIIGVVMTTFTIVFCRQILAVMKTPENIMEDAYIYCIVIFAGIPASLLYNMTSGIVRALGDSRTPLIILAISAVFNVALDSFFVIVCKIGVFGAALATVLAQLIAGTLCLIYMIRKFTILRMTKEERLFKGEYSLHLLGMGLPMGFQYSITALGCLVLQASINELGSAYVAVVSAAGKVSNLLTSPFESLGAAMATWTGQHIGAKKLDRIKSGLYLISLMCIIYSIFAFVLCFFLGEQMGLMFLDKDALEFLSNVRLYLVVNTSFYTFLTLVNTVRFTIQGMGYATLAVVAGVFEMFARSGAGLLLVPAYGFFGACFGNPLAWIAADIFLIPTFYICFNRLKKKMSLEKIAS